MADDEWVITAMTDETVVVKLLMQLKYRHRPDKLFPPKRNDESVSLSRSLEWSIHHRRSNQVTMRIGCEEVKGKESTRVSPTTPLSWSGGTSVCGGAAIDAGEESSRQVKRSERARSKVISPSEATPIKRPRKKKTLVEIKQEESLLLKEKKDLQDELASLRFTVAKQRTTNESLKRMKFDVQFQSATKKVTTSSEFEHAISSQHQQHKENCDAEHPNLRTNISSNRPSKEAHHSLSYQTSNLRKNATSKEKLALLPDLNLPSEEISNSDSERTIIGYMSTNN